MKIIEILLSHIREKNKIKNRNSLFHLVQYFKITFCYNLFNVSRLLFVLFDSIFQDFSSLLHTQNSLHFHSTFSLLLIYIHMPTPLYVISYQIHSNKKRCHLPSAFQQHLHNSNIVISFDSNPSYE